MVYFQYSDRFSFFYFMIFFILAWSSLTSATGYEGFFDGNEYPRDCGDALRRCAEPPESGIVEIRPIGYKMPFKVYCNNDVDGGGWTVIQRRKDGSVNFTRDWESYKQGFGFLSGEFWIGNEKIAYLTNQKKYELRIDMVYANDNERYLSYDDFRINDEMGKYQLTNLGALTGNTQQGYDYMRAHSGMKFTTYDNDNDLNVGNCGVRFSAGWWFKSCYTANLNGRYDGVTYQSINLYNRNTKTRLSSIKFVEMKIRAID